MPKIDKHCFITGSGSLICSEACMAYTKEGNSRCRVLNAIEKLVPVATRPVAPILPKNPVG